MLISIQTITIIITNCNYNYNSNNIFPRLIHFIGEKIYDDCTYKQWVIRCSIDIMIRFCVTIITDIA